MASLLSKTFWIYTGAAFALFVFLYQVLPQFIVPEDFVFTPPAEVSSVLPYVAYFIPFTDLANIFLYWAQTILFVNGFLCIYNGFIKNNPLFSIGT